MNAKIQWLWDTIHTGIDTVKAKLSGEGYAPVGVIYVRPKRWEGDDQDTVMTWPNDYPRSERIRVLKEMAASYEADTVGTSQHYFQKEPQA